MKTTNTRILNWIYTYSKSGKLIRRKATFGEQLAFLASSFDAAQPLKHDITVVFTGDKRSG